VPPAGPSEGDELGGTVGAGASVAGGELVVAAAAALLGNASFEEHAVADIRTSATNAARDGLARIVASRGDHHEERHVSDLDRVLTTKDSD
jgi:hypothetical protein